MTADAANGNGIQRLVGRFNQGRSDSPRSLWAPLQEDVIQFIQANNNRVTMTTSTAPVDFLISNGLVSSSSQFLLMPSQAAMDEVSARLENMHIETMRFCFFPEHQGRIFSTHSPA